MRVTINFNKEESMALSTLSDVECRDPHAQILFILRAEFARLGLILPKETMLSKQNTIPSATTIPKE